MGTVQMVILSVGQERYGVSVMQVQSIERALAITPVPRTLPFIKGVANLRGAVVPVIDLRERLGHPPRDTDAGKIVVVEVDDMAVGMIVDEVLDVATLNEGDIDAPPAMVGGLDAVYLEGVTRFNDELLILLNLNRVLSDVETRQLHEVEKSVTG